MPQMMPLSWLMLFIVFSTTLILFATMNYYTNIEKAKSHTKENYSTNSLTWKW
nr:ATP synthase F0 subunit 8 [Eucryptotermes sp. n. nr. breviceps]